MRIAIVQRVVKSYRLPVYRELSRDHEVRFIYGDDIPGTKSRSCDLTGINCAKCRTSHFRIGSKIFTIHWDLIAQLRKFDPDCILSEGESHIFGYLQTIIYRSIYNPRTGVMKWCFIDLPGDERHGVRFFLKYLSHRPADAFVLYSSYSKKALMRYNISKDKAFVAVNVSDTQTLLHIAEKRYIKKAEARRMLGIPDLFTVLFIGNLEKQKRFERYLEVAALCKEHPIQFLVAGGGANLAYYKSIATQCKLRNVHFLGHLKDPSNSYFASDIVYIPGRGGMVISEALCFARPVLLHYADGTESDLIDGQNTGYILDDTPNAVASLLVEMVQHPDSVVEMGKRGQELIKKKYNTENMAREIVRAANFSISRRSRL